VRTVLLFVAYGRVAAAASSAHHVVGTDFVLGTTPRATLSNGLRVDMVGLGTSSGMRLQHVANAITTGYRYLDTAQAERWSYREDEVGQAWKDSGIRRQDFFLQTKIDPESLGYAATKQAFAQSLQRLQTDYVDSILIHKPRCWEGACSRQPEGTWQDSWKALEEFYHAGEARAIGICDVDAELLPQLLRMSVQPHIIQNWFDPFHQDTEMRRRIQDSGILYQGYSTLGPQWHHFMGLKENPVFSSPVLREIAASHDAQVAQVVLQWAVRRGVSAIPSSHKAARLASNWKSFSFRLKDEQLAQIDNLDGTVRREERDPNEVELTFDNRGAAKLEVYWAAHDGTEVKMGELSPGQTMRQNTHHSHKFLFKQPGKPVRDHVVDAQLGGTQRHTVGIHDET